MRYDGRKFDTWEEIEIERNKIDLRYKEMTGHEHFFHLTLSLISGGIWLMVWAYKIWEERQVIAGVREDLGHLQKVNADLFEEHRIEHYDSEGRYRV